MALMRAVVIRRPGDIDALAIAEVPRPEPGTGEVRVRVIAAGINRADLLQRRGRYPAPPGVPADIPGLEFAGVIDAAGPGVARLQEGMRVFGLVGGGAQAEYLIVPAGMCTPIPDNLDFVAAAAVPEAFITAFDALFNQGRLRLGERVLVHAVGSGVATAALQLAVRAGAEVWGTSRSPAKVERALGLGLAAGLPAEGFAAAARAKSGGRGVDLILDFVGGPYLQANVEALAPQGRLICLGLLGEPRKALDLGAVLAKRLRIIGAVLRSRSLDEKLALIRQFQAHVVPLLASGAVRPVIDRVLPREAVGEAHAALERNETFGKIVLSVGAP
ncbi:MAG TPA: NAD(P)H-quinone oxidoreductase [Limnochordia bacterium]